MSEFANSELTFKETYTLLWKVLKRNQIYMIDEDSGWLCWVRLIVNILALTSHTAGVVEKFGKGADIVQISTDMSGVLILMQGVLLHTQLCVNRKLIKNLVIHLELKWRIDNQLSSEMKAIKHESMTSFLRRITLFYKTLTVYIFLYMGPPFVYTTIKHCILKEDVIFLAPFYAKMPFRTDDNFLLYCLVRIVDFKILWDVAYLVTFDIVLINATMHHLRLLFTIMQDDLRHIVQPGDIGHPGETTAEMKLKKLIPHHQELLKLTSEISDAFGAIFITHLAFFSATTCFLGFAASVQPSPESIRNLLASNIILVCIYTCCYYGQTLTDASVDIAEAAYEGNWHLASHEYRRCILFMMLRSEKTEYIKSTSFVNISLETFTKMGRIAMTLSENNLKN